MGGHRVDAHMLNFVTGSERDWGPGMGSDFLISGFQTWCPSIESIVIGICISESLGSWYEGWDISRGEERI